MMSSLNKATNTEMSRYRSETYVLNAWLLWHDVFRCTERTKKDDHFFVNVLSQKYP